MDKNNKDFLKNLKYELLTQKPDGTRDPRVWGILEEEQIPSTEDNAAGYEIRTDDGEFVTSGTSKEELIEVFKNSLNGAPLVAVSEAAEKVFAGTINEFSDLLYFDLSEIVDVYNALSDWHHSKWEIFYYSVKHVLAPGKVFFTLKGASEYIEKYGYNHKNPITYSMYPDRCSDYIKLLEILKSEDFSSSDEEDWISVKDRLPSDCEPVWIFDGKNVETDSFDASEVGKIHKTNLKNEDGSDFSYSSNGWYEHSCERFSEPLFWMPIKTPKPPKI